MPVIVGFGHRTGVGKDTAARLLMEILPPHIVVKRRAFADAVKEDCARMFGYAGHRDREHYDRFREHRYIPLPDIGKSPFDLWNEHWENMRQIDPRTWVRRAFDDAVGEDVAIVTDVRRHNECDEIHQRGGIVARIDNPRPEKRHTKADTALACWDEWDSVVRNDGDLSLFRQRLIPIRDWVIQQIRKGERCD